MLTPRGDTYANSCVTGDSGRVMTFSTQFWITFSLYAVVTSLVVVPLYILRHFVSKDEPTAANGGLVPDLHKDVPKGTLKLTRQYSSFYDGRIVRSVLIWTLQVRPSRTV